MKERGDHNLEGTAYVAVDDVAPSFIVLFATQVAVSSVAAKLAATNAAGFGEYLSTFIAAITQFTSNQMPELMQMLQQMLHEFTFTCNQTAPLVG